MICRNCLTRATRALSRPIVTTQAAASAPTPSPFAARRAFSQSVPRLSSAPAPQPPTGGPESSGPVFSTPLADSDAAAAAAATADQPLSACPEGTVLTGLNYFKNRTDPVALPDAAYPPWLWRCLDVQKKQSEEGETADAGDEFSKSKKQRRLAAKRQRAQEAQLLAEGNLAALAPKIPLQHQTVNLPANDDDTTEGAVAAAEAREDLRRAMRRERKAKIKEDNYLKSM